MVAEPSPAAILLRRGLRLEYITLSWNVVGCFVLVAAAIAARSVALAGFGADSAIEIVASLIVIWQLTGTRGDGRERTALRVIAVAFGLLATYVAVQATVVLATGSHPRHSASGIVWLGLTVATMLTLAAGKRSTGIQLDNAVLQTEARVTLIDGLLAAAILMGITVNALLGWWWADPVSALVIVYYGARESRHAWREAG